MSSIDYEALADMIEALPVRNWAKSLAFDNDLGEELNMARITCSFPNYPIVTEWVISQVMVRTSTLGRRYILFFAEADIQGEKYVQKIKIYSPHLPRTKDVEEYLGGRIVGANLVCSVRSGDSQVLIAHFIRVIKHNGKKSNPIVRPAGQSSLDESIANQLVRSKDYSKHPQLTDLQMYELYYPAKQAEKFKRSLNA